MSVMKFAAFAGAAVVLTLAVTVTITQIMLPAQRFEACIEGSVAGGNIGGPFELMDHRGRMVTDAQVLDHPALVYFGYTFCPDCDILGSCSDLRLHIHKICHRSNLETIRGP